MSERPHPTVVKHIQRWRSDFSIQENPNAVPGEFHDRFMICRSIPIVRCIDGAFGIYAQEEEQYAVLTVPQVQDVDYRWIPIIEGSRWESRESLNKRMQELRWEKDRQVMNAVDEWARDEGYWHFRKNIGEQFNFTSANNKRPGAKYRDPYARTMEHQDKLGRMLK